VYGVRVMARVKDHLYAWAAAIFVGWIVFFRYDTPPMLDPFYWYYPLIWVLTAAAVILVCLLLAFIPAIITTVVLERYQVWKKPTKIIFLAGLFMVVTLCAAFVIRLPVFE
jgi:hypothetical protein